jgi:hypothetical protein
MQVRNLDNLPSFWKVSQSLGVTNLKRGEGDEGHWREMPGHVFRYSAHDSTYTCIYLY